MDHLVSQTFGVGLFTMALIFILALGVPFLYGGEADEVIRFMEMSPELELNDVDEFDEDASIWLEQVEEEKRLIEALPVVDGAVSFFYLPRRHHESQQSSSLCRVLLGEWTTQARDGQLRRDRAEADAP